MQSSVSARHTVKRIITLAVIGCLLGSCGSGEPQKEDSSSEPDILIVGIDGLEPQLLQDLMDQGRLPNFQRLVKRGSFAVIDCVVGTTSPVVWTTVATGVSPEEHGITGFTVNDQPVTSGLRKRDAFWNILPRFGDLSVATVGWMVTWPAEADAGIMVSDRAHWGRFRSKVMPENAVDLGKHQSRESDKEIASRFTEYPYDPDYGSFPETDSRYAANFLLDRRLISIYRRDTMYHGIAKEILQRDNNDVVAVYFQGVDYVSHGFWKWFEPEPFREAGWKIDPAEVDQLAGIIPKYYRYIDRLVGDLLREVGPETLVVVLSDHGFGTGLGQYRVEGGDFISGNHRFLGSLILSGNSIINGLPQRGTITHFDILPTLLYYLSLPLGRDLPGHPLLRYFEDAQIDARQVEFIAGHTANANVEEARVEPKESEHDEEILDELRSLGYIE